MADMNMADHGNGAVGRLVLDGPRTLRTAEQSHAALLDMVRRHATVEIDCGGADEVDASFIQVLLAARASAARAGGAVRLAHPPSGALRAALVRGGFLDGAPVKDGPVQEGAAAERAFWSAPEPL